MEMFKFNKSEIQDLCRDLKAKVNRSVRNADYCEYAIMYNGNREYFYICETIEVEELEAKGSVLYHSFSHYSIDGLVTIKGLKEKIFKM